MTPRPIWLAAVLAAACGTAVPRPEAAPSTPNESAAQTGLPLFLGFRMTDSPDAISRAAPELLPVEQSDEGVSVLEGVRAAQGVNLRIRLVFKDAQLSTVTARATPSTLSEFEALSSAIHESLGPGDPMECGSDEGVAFEDYIASGHGSRHVEWLTEKLSANVHLSTLSDGRVQMSAHAAWLPFQEPFDLAEMPSSSRAAKEDSTCEEANLNPQEDFLGVPFGASMAQARAELGGEIDHDRLGVSTQLAGVRGRAHLRFYDDCLAAVVFVADEPNTAGYRSLVQAMQGSERTIRLERCSPDGEPPNESMLADGRGYLSARWEGTASGQVRLGRVSAKELVVELEYGPLRGRAPQIDFSE